MSNMLNKKFNIELASVLLGVTLYGGAQVIHADTISNNASTEATTTTASNSASTEATTTTASNSASTEATTTTASNNASNTTHNTETTNHSLTFSNSFAKIDPKINSDNVIPILDSNQVSQITANIKATNPWLTNDDIHVELDGTTTVNVNGSKITLTPYETVNYSIFDLTPVKLQDPIAGYKYIADIVQTDSNKTVLPLTIVNNYVPGFHITDLDMDNYTIHIYQEALPQSSKIIYVDDDENGKEINTSPINGKTDEKITPIYNIPDNYDYVSGKVDSYKFKANNNDPIIIHLNHHTYQISQNKTVNETIKYRYENGNKAFPDYIAVVKLTRNGIKDAVTGKISWKEWSTDQFQNIYSPKLEGYSPDIKVINAIVVTGSSSDINKLVTYIKLNNQSAKSYISPKTVNNQHANNNDNQNGNGTVGFNNNSGENGQSYKQSLPQTGDAKPNSSIIGLGFASFIAMLGLADVKKKDN